MRPQPGSAPLPQPTTPPVPPAPRAGFTLVELLVAVLLVSVGLVALAASAGHYTRSVARAEALAHATRRARAALEAERARPCVAATPGAQAVAATVALPAGVTHAGSGSLTLRSAFPCPR